LKKFLIWTLVFFLIFFVVSQFFENEFEKDYYEDDSERVAETPKEPRTEYENEYEKKAKMKATEDDVYLLAKLIEGEAGGESFEGKVAVGTVVMNRVQDERFNNDIKKVIYSARQFTVVSLSRWKYIEPSRDSITAANLVLDGHRAFEKDILFFYNPDKATDWDFIRSVAPAFRIGNHVFARHK